MGQWAGLSILAGVVMCSVHGLAMGSLVFVQAHMDIVFLSAATAAQDCKSCAWTGLKHRSTKQKLKQVQDNDPKVMEGGPQEAELCARLV